MQYCQAVTFATIVHKKGGTLAGIGKSGLPAVVIRGNPHWDFVFDKAGPFRLISNNPNRMRFKL
jgi:hypothetical protein